MSIRFEYSASIPSDQDTLVITVFEDLELGTEGKAIDQACGHIISDVLERQKNFKGKHGQTLTIQTPKDSPYHQIVLVGIGHGDDNNDEPDNEDTELNEFYTHIEETGGKLFQALKSCGAANTTIILDMRQNSGLRIDEASLSAHLLAGLKLSSYKFDKYKKPKEDGETEAKLDVITFKVHDPDYTKQVCRELNAEVRGVITARDLGNEPANHLYPESFARTIMDELEPLGVKVTVIDDKKLDKMGAGAFMAVGVGSDHPPRLVLMEWKGAGKPEKGKYPLALVGKGITFDTGGISIKPSGGMQDMKMDMCGAAVVVGAMKSLALRNAETNVIGAVGLAENMPSHRSYRPGDIVRSLSGQTIEIHNTDAEGRLVLADTLTYIQKHHKPDTIIDLATLTGAIMVALGSTYAGAFVNDDDLWQALDQAGESTGEKLWRMPLDKDYKKEMESDIADLKNLGGGRLAGACTAAGFLEHFIEDGVKWSHMDIAGVSWGKSKTVTRPGTGASGFGVRTLNRYMRATLETE